MIAMTFPKENRFLIQTYLPHNHGSNVITFCAPCQIGKCNWLLNQTFLKALKLIGKCGFEFDLNQSQISLGNIFALVNATKLCWCKNTWIRIQNFSHCLIIKVFNYVFFFAPVRIKLSVGHELSGLLWFCSTTGKIQLLPKISNIAEVIWAQIPVRLESRRWKLSAKPNYN